MDGLVVVASGLPYWRLFGVRGPVVLAVAELLNAVSTVAGVWPGWAFGGKQSRGVIRDWAVTARRGRFAARLGLTERLAGVTTPILAISVDGDRYTPPVTTDLLVGIMPAAAVTRRHVTDAEAGTRLDHFRWVKTPGPVLDHVTAWLPAPVRRA